MVLVVMQYQQYLSLHTSVCYNRQHVRFSGSLCAIMIQPINMTKSRSEIRACMFFHKKYVHHFEVFVFEVKHAVDHTLYERNSVLALSGRTRLVLSVLVEESKQGTRNSSWWEWRAGIFKARGIRLEQQESYELWKPLY